MAQLDYFARLLPELSARSASAALSRLGFALEPLNQHLDKLFSRAFGEPGSLLADPAFEAVFGWQQAEVRMSDLAGKLLHERLVDALDNPPDLEDERCPEPNRERRRRNHPYRFGQDRRPYLHQVDSWRVLCREDPQSLIVASGTGSGKTECFMLPILDRLVRQQVEQGGRLHGVRALFLYPLNALINSQRERLRAWTHAFDGNIRFCLYNGNTPENRPPARQRHQYPGEVMDRTTLRDSPPPILVTNATMLEYMLVRTIDAPILEQSQGRLEWVVLDEAHTYVGSQAAELALLIRRVMHAFGADARQVRFVATSATIGDPGGEAGRQLKRFLAEVAGVDPDRVNLVAGKREVPPLPAAAAGYSAASSLTSLLALDPDSDDGAPAPERHKALAGHPTARAIRELFIEAERRNREQGGSGMVATLDEVGRLLHRDAWVPDREQQTEALHWLDLLSGSRDTDGRPFLPLRGHLFHQTLSGLWACADRNCPERHGTDLDDATWPFGRLYLEPRQHCVCGSPVYELAACEDCGQPHLIAAARSDCLVPPRGESAIDEFELDIEPEDGAEDGDDGQGGQNDEQGDESRVLIVNRPGLPHTSEELVERASRRFADVERTGETLRLTLQEDAGKGLTCPCCNGQERGRKLLQQARVGAPFALGIILPTLLELAPDERCKPAELPYRGRRLLTFNDSRQGTARMAARLQQESERNRIRALVYHLTLREGTTQSGTEASQLRERIAEYQQQLEYTLPQGRPLIERTLGEMQGQLASLTMPKPIPFNELAKALSDQGQDFALMRDHYRDDISSTAFGRPDSALLLANLFLVREFGRRPKRLNSLESMGMVAVHYPGLGSIQSPHPSFQLDEWRSFLKIALDFFARAQGVLAIDEPTRHWLGMRFPRRFLVERDRPALDRGELRWPRAARSGIRSTLVRLLAHVLPADVETADGQDLIDEVLGAAWTALTQESDLLKPTEGGRRTLPLDRLAFAPMTSAWVCPVTRRFLDVTLRRITPYLPVKATEATSTCDRIQIPLYDRPFGGDADPMDHIAKARQWLANQDEIKRLRQRGLWQALNDRVIELAPYFTAGEHSAQQPSKRLARYEQRFKRGELNLLSCSTTMEMGIDIGGIAMVAMNNVPPHPANYLQRAGRAGRRQEARSLAMTLCKSNPHDQIVFHDTRWPFVTPLPAPRVSLNSAVIVQRHVNALVLTDFLRRVGEGAGQDIAKLTCGRFFAADLKRTPAKRFVDGCTTWANADGDLAIGLRALIRSSAFEGTDEALLVRRTGEAMQTVIDNWTSEWEALCREEEQTRGNNIDPPIWPTLCNGRGGGQQAAGGAANQAVRYQACRMFGEYLLRELADQGFLPAYGFPTHLAAFDNYTIDRWQQQRNQPAQREDNRYRHRELANRDSVTALREYAPGADVVMDGLVYRSAGITLNWKVPASESESREIQVIKHAWRCRQCGASGSSRILDAARHCSECGAEIDTAQDLAQSNRRTFLEPSGFAVDFYVEPHNDVSTQQFIPVEPAWVSGGGEWVPLKNPDLGRFRVTTRGHLFHQSNGLHGRGYAVCLMCGRAAPMGETGLPDVFQGEHKKLRGTQGDTDRICPGSHQPWAIKSGLTLGHESHTDVLEIQLRNLDGQWLNDPVTALTLAVALRDGLAGLLGVRADELGCTEKDAHPGAGAHCRSILIYDRYAAGYASGVAQHLDRLFDAAAERLSCRASCDSACPQCVLDYDQRFLADALDRHRALGLLSSAWLHALRLPSELAFFGDDSRSEYTDLGGALLREARSAGLRAIRLFGGGSQSDVGVSPLRHWAYRLAGLDYPVLVVVDETTLSKMADEDRHLLAALAAHPRVSVHRIGHLPTARSGVVVAEVVQGEQACRWASPDPAAREFGPAWGEGRPLVMGDGLAPIAEVGERVSVDALRPVPLGPGDKELEVHHELDGPLRGKGRDMGFGKRFWKLIAEQHPVAGKLLSDSDGPGIIGVEYRDRYLWSPLAAALLLQVVDGARELIGSKRFDSASITIRTVSDANAPSRYPSSKVWSNWPRPTDRDAALKAAFKAAKLPLSIHAVPKPSASHGRSLELTFADETRLRVRFDQGVGYWRMSRSAAGPDTSRFDFDATVEKQGKAIAQLKGSVEGVAQPTQLFLSVR